MKVGFTGTQTGMTGAQIKTVEELLSRLHPEEAAHGDCLGADADFNTLCNKYDIPIVLHPPTNPSKRAFCAAKTMRTRPKKEYLERNKDIVNETDLLIACPKGEKEELRSGTWSTIRYAKKVGKKVIVVLPNGGIQ